MTRQRGPWTLVGVIVVVATLSIFCSCGLVVFWMMLGSPWPIDLSAFAE
jgi:hypothetical protein